MTLNYTHNVSQLPLEMFTTHWSLHNEYLKGLYISMAYPLRVDSFISSSHGEHNLYTRYIILQYEYKRKTNQR